MKFDVEHAEPLRALLGGLNQYAKYRTDPVRFASEVLGVTLWSKQAEIANALVQNRRVLVKSCNNAGKTLLAAVLSIWFFLCYEIGECVITGPRQEQLADTTFKEIRTLYGGRPGTFPRSPRIETAPDHYIKATTAKDSTAWQGLHGRNIFLIFEECTGVEAQFWDGARGILSGGENTYWLAIFNPTDTSSQAFIEEQSGNWDVHTISAFDHPNIVNELAGKPCVIPSAIRLGALKHNMNEWGTWVKEGDQEPADIRFAEINQPVKWWRPGPIGDSRILGRFPSQSAYSIFCDADFDLAQSFKSESDEFFRRIYRNAKQTGDSRAGYPDRHGVENVPKFGIDVARFGDDRTCITGYMGKYIFHHEFHNGQNTTWTSNRAKLLCNDYGDKFGITPHKIPVLIDDTGIGGGVVDQKGDYNFIPINSATTALNERKYPRKRDEMLFQLAEKMRAGEVRFASTIDRRIIQEIKRQAMSITYKADGRGRRVAEGKDSVKEKVRRSPDDTDSLALATYSIGAGYTEHIPLDLPKKSIYPVR